MTMWLIRAGKVGEREVLALREQVAIIGWDELPDLAGIETRGALETLMRRTYADQKPRTLSSWHGQVWSFRDTIRQGDLVVLPLKSRATIVLGTVSGQYCHRADLAGGPYHTRPVQWHTEVPRTAFDVDILLSFGAFMTVCRIERNDAEQRVRDLMAEGTEPLPDTRHPGHARASDDRSGAGAHDVLQRERDQPEPACQGFAEPVLRFPATLLADYPPPRPTSSSAPAPSRAATAEIIRLADPVGEPLPPRAVATEMERRSRSLIRERVTRKFKGHRMAVLVAAVLDAEGFHTTVSPPGPDGGVDILAGSGPLGLSAPRLVVQVKSQESKIDVRPLRELSGVMVRYQAEHGLLVGWGGFNQGVRNEAATDHFRIRLWDADDLISAIERHYPDLPVAIRTVLPLKQVWTLAPEADAWAAG